MATYLVTGCAGFIASKVSEMLLAEGHYVVGVDNLNDAYDVRLKHWRLNRLQAIPEFQFHLLDIVDYQALQSIFATEPRFDAVFNLAARAGVRQSVENPWVYLETNSQGNLNLLDLCRLHEIPKFILASTSSLYGANNPRPFHEDADTNMPLSPYAASKKAAETMCYTYHYLYGIDITVFRYFTVYGPAGRPDMSLFRFVQWVSEERPVTIFGDGQQSRDFTYVEDIARGTIAGLKPVGYEVINLGSDKPVGLLDVLNSVEACVGKKANLVYAPRHPADVMATWANIGRAKVLLGWEPRTSIQSGIEHLVAWYKDNREWAKDIETD